MSFSARPQKSPTPTFHTEFDEPEEKENPMYMKSRDKKSNYDDNYNQPSVEEEKIPPVGSSRDSICSIWGDRTPYYGEGQWPIRVDYRILEAPEKWVTSACILCSNGCGLEIGVKNNTIVGVRGRASDRVNHGRLGPKGLHAFEANASPDRLKYPMIRNEQGELVETTWDIAMSKIVTHARELLSTMSQHSIGFYTSGQLFLEEYYALAMIGKGGLHSLHMDGNTRLCTATAAAALRETFGADGQPGSYTDIDVTDCIFLVGHNISNTQTVLWSRMLDRIKGPKPPHVIVLDPRCTQTAKEATHHIAPLVGTNVAVLNGLIHLLFKFNYVKMEWVKQHTIGVDELRKVTNEYPPERVESITGVPASILIEVAHVLGKTPTLLSTCLQGVYQSNQATAAACQVNNINLLLGHIGRPGSGIYQMNGQPTAQNNRETGCNGEFPGFRNYQNPVHMNDLAKIWNIPVHDIPHWHVPTHIMQMLHFIQTGTIRMFWVSGTNPLVSLPELERVRKILTLPHVFVVVQDAFMTETASIADVVLPAALWGEKTGCFTNVDRTVHISMKAIDPPGEARSDLDIFLDFAKRMEFKDQDGAPLIKFSAPEEAFNAWARCTKNCICDYTGLSYQKLMEHNGIQWPVNEKHPDGTERLYTDWQFFTTDDMVESYGHDLETGTPITPQQFAELKPNGRAILKSVHYRASEEMPSTKYPFGLLTGRNVFHFHTRTKTGRSQALSEAAPDSYVEIHTDDAARLGIQTNDLVRVENARGALELHAQVTDNIERGHLFIPFHYGYWDTQAISQPSQQTEDGHTYTRKPRASAANELTQTQWDPVSKQPCFKGGAVTISKLDSGTQVKIHVPERMSKYQETKHKHIAKHQQHILKSEHKSENKPFFKKFTSVFKRDKKGTESPPPETTTAMASSSTPEASASSNLNPNATTGAMTSSSTTTRSGTTTPPGTISTGPTTSGQSPEGHVYLRNALGTLIGFISGIHDDVIPSLIERHGSSLPELRQELCVMKDICETIIHNFESQVKQYECKSYITDGTTEAKALSKIMFHPRPKVSVAYQCLRDIHNFHALASQCHAMLNSLKSGSSATLDPDFTNVVNQALQQIDRLVSWGSMKSKALAPQTLLVPSK